MSGKLSQIIHTLVKRTIHLKTEKNNNFSSTCIKNELLADKPSMIARFGSTEIKAVLYSKTPWFLMPLLKYMMKFNSESKEFLNMKILSGFFPSNKENIQKFSQLMHEDMKELDILGSWRFEERFLVSNFKQAKLVKLDVLEPYLQTDPWSEVLKDKNVLVIHPFSETITKQYTDNREVLFKDKRVLPQFKSLQTMKAVQTLSGDTSEFTSWFEALDHMKAEINKMDFDFAIIGCGAYGFPLAAHIKRMGKKAIHLGGPTQLLFGIKGKRWVDNKKFENIINEHFVHPSNLDKPANFSKVEGGCYW